MINKLVQQAIQDLETNYVSAKGDRIIVRHHNYVEPSRKCYSVYVTDYVSPLGTKYTEITYYNSLAFLFNYYFASYRHIFLKSEHPELLI